MSLAEVLSVQDRQVNLATAAELAMELQAEGGCSGIFHAMKEEDVHRIMQHPQTMVASDGGILAPGEDVPHPRNYGTFSRVLGHYSRDPGVLSFAEAIRKMTSLPARTGSISPTAASSRQAAAPTSRYSIGTPSTTRRGGLREPAPLRHGHGAPLRHGGRGHPRRRGDQHATGPRTAARTVIHEGDRSQPEGFASFTFRTA